jgi:hypothetical protein
MYINYSIIYVKFFCYVFRLEFSVLVVPAMRPLHICNSLSLVVRELMGAERAIGPSWICNKGPRFKIAISWMFFFH